MKSKLLIIISILGIIFCIFFAVHVWALSSIGQKYEDNQNISMNLQSDMIKSEQLANFQKSLKKSSEEKNALLALFIKNDDIPNFIQSLETIMKNLKIVGTTKSVAERAVPELTSSGKDELLISFEAEGSYSNLMQFVDILENLPYKSYISTATLIKEDSGAIAKPLKTIPWKLDLTLNIVKINNVQPPK